MALMRAAQKKCSGHSCGFGWLPNSSKAVFFGERDEDCCAKQVCREEHAPCSLSEGWTDSNASDEPYCCQATCKRWDCKVAEHWLTFPSKENITAASNDDCCVRSCLHHKCSSGMSHIPEGNITRGNTDSECCEPVGCPYFRENLTRLEDGAYCNSLGESSNCITTFQKMADSSLVPCMWDESYALCRNNISANVTGCSGF